MRLNSLMLRIFAAALCAASLCTVVLGLWLWFRVFWSSYAIVMMFCLVFWLIIRLALQKFGRFLMLVRVENLKESIVLFVWVGLVCV